MLIECDLARHHGEHVLPRTTPNVMAAERTFMEKVSAMHALSMRGRLSSALFASRLRPSRNQKRMASPQRR